MGNKVMNVADYKYYITMVVKGSMGHEHIDACATYHAQAQL